MEVLISIVIPTRTRAETLKYSLKSALDQDFDDYEIIVSDNVSDDNTIDVINSFDDIRIKYVNPGRRLSMCDNWEFALKHVNGKYTIFIGDDDAVIPGTISKLAEFIKSTNYADAYTWPSITYWWPIDSNQPWITNTHLENVKSNLKKWNGILKVENNLKEIANKTITHGLLRYSDLPMSYHNAISTKVYKEILASTGRVFHCNAPDFVTYLEIPVFADSVVRLPCPITIFGVSAKSNGGSSTAKDGKNVAQKFIDEYGAYDFHPWLPLSLGVPLRLHMDNFLKPLLLFPKFYDSSKFNYSAMWAFMRRLGLIKKSFIYKNLFEIKKCNKFNIFTFEFYCFVNDFFSFRRKILNANIGCNKKLVSETNIYDYVNRLSKELFSKS